MLDSERYRSDTSGETEPASERSLFDDIRALISDGRLLAEAEIDFHKKRAIYSAKQGRTIAVLFVVAGVLAFFAVMALVLGLVLALGEVITYWGSTAVVTGTLLVIAGLLISRGKAKARKLKAILTDEDDMR